MDCEAERDANLLRSGEDIWIAELL